MKPEAPVKGGFLSLLVAIACVQCAFSAHIRSSPGNSTKGDNSHIPVAAVASLPIPAAGLLSMLANFLTSMKGDTASISGTAGTTIDWTLAKVLIGAVLLMPSMPAVMRWKLRGRPPHPFLLSENAVDWPNWLHDLAQIMAIVGVDLVILGGLEWNWHKTQIYLFSFLGVMYGAIGFTLFMFSVMSSKSEYADAAQKPGSEEQVEPLIAESQYQDVGLSLVHLVVVVVAQSILIGMYAKEMVKSIEITPRAYWYWAVAIPMQIIAREMMGRSFCAQLRLWNRLLHAEEGSKVRVQRGDGDDCQVLKVRYSEILTRSIFSYYANCLCMAMISFTLPVFMMSAASDIDFVKDCFAVVFITTLDDLNEAVPLKIMRSDRADAERPA